MKENNKLKLNIQTFAEGDGGSEGGAAGAETKPEAKYTDEDVNRLVAAAKGKEKSGFLKSLGFEKEDDLKAAMKDYQEYLKTKKSAEEIANEAKSKAERERDEALNKLTAYERKEMMAEAKVNPDFYDYVAFRVGKSVDEKTDFKKALTAFAKENPKYLLEEEDGEEDPEDPLKTTLITSLKLQNNKKKQDSKMSPAEIINSMKKGKVR